jgi:methylenetetrahydrofolate dehydrogenase (NADP+)/methenyltetrahydrofolate cyclohydrolase
MNKHAHIKAKLIDGKTVAADLRAKIAVEAAKLKKEHGLVPGLAVVLVGTDPASEIYVRNKVKQTEEAGLNSFEHKLDASTSQQDLLALVEKLNQDSSVHGILVQFPLPAHLDQQSVINAISPAKDVDGLNPVNTGKLASGLPALAPCTPLGCIILAKSVHASLKGMDAVVIGRSHLVGRPLAQLLLQEDATVTIAHSRTRDLKEQTRRADLVFAAVGKPELVRGDWIRPGATVIDVGINRIDAGDGKSRIVGDVNFAEAADVAGAITPVPGGVGPMTIACLLANTLSAACAAKGLPAPKL